MIFISYIILDLITVIRFVFRSNNGFRCRIFFSVIFERIFCRYSNLKRSNFYNCVFLGIFIIRIGYFYINGIFRNIRKGNLVDILCPFLAICTVFYSIATSKPANRYGVSLCIINSLVSCYVEVHSLRTIHFLNLQIRRYVGYFIIALNRCSCWNNDTFISSHIFGMVCTRYRVLNRICCIDQTVNGCLKGVRTGLSILLGIVLRCDGNLCRGYFQSSRCGTDIIFIGYIRRTTHDLVTCDYIVAASHICLTTGDCCCQYIPI